MDEALHLLRIVSLLHYVGHFINFFVELIGYVEHPRSSKVHKKPDVIGVKAGQPFFTCEILHDNSHHRCISINQVREKKDGFTVVFIPRL